MEVFSISTIQYVILNYQVSLESAWLNRRHWKWSSFFHGIQHFFLRVRIRSDGAAIPRRRSGTDTHSPPRGTGPAIDTPPRAAACPSSPHKISVNRGRIESPDKRRLATFGSAGSINYPDRKTLPEGHPLRPTHGSTRHSSLGDHKSLEAEALAEVRNI